MINEMQQRIQELLNMDIGTTPNGITIVALKEAIIRNDTQKGNRHSALTEIQVGRVLSRMTIQVDQEFVESEHFENIIDNYSKIVINLRDFMYKNFHYAGNELLIDAAHGLKLIHG